MVIGCIEFIVVVFCVVKVIEILGKRFERIKVLFSVNIFKNVMGVGILGIGMIGLFIVIVLGVLIGKFEY